jgi:hypothetical protein
LEKKERMRMKEKRCVVELENNSISAVKYIDDVRFVQQTSPLLGFC